MRLAVFIVVAAAATKVWYQDQVHRQALGDALLQSNLAAAAETCIKETGKATGQKPMRAVNWSAGKNAKVVVGNPRADVALWDIDSPLWNVRYRHPHIILSGDTAASPTCAYDLVARIAAITSSP